MPIGTPPNGRETSAFPAARRAPSGSRWQKAFRSDARDRPERHVRALRRRDIEPERKASTREHGVARARARADEGGVLGRKLYVHGRPNLPARTSEAGIGTTRVAGPGERMMAHGSAPADRRSTT